MGGQQSAPGLEETTEKGGGRAEGRVGHDLVGPAGQAKVAGIGLDDDHRGGEALAQLPGPPRVRLDGDDSGAGFHQRSGERAAARADVDDDGTRRDPGLGDQPLRPSTIELVPSPPPRRDHDGAP